MWNGFWCYRYLLWNLVSRDFKLKYRRSVLGVVWSVLNPLLMCLVYWAVFSSLMDMRGSGIDNFAVFLMCGQLLDVYKRQALESGDQELCGRMQDTTIAVSRVLTVARRNAGIRFPCDH